MFRVPSTSGVPTARRSSEGPSALMTPLAPRTAASTAALSLSSPATTVSFGSLNVSLLGDRTDAVTSSPRFSACDDLAPDASRGAEDNDPPRGTNAGQADHDS